MALPILDGNQSATTLSSILTSGEHIPAHTVVSLGTQAITNIATAVSGSVVSISNFPATQPVSIASVTIGSLPAISGTVTANVLFSADVGESMPPQVVALGFYSGDDGGIAAVDDTNRKLPISGTVTVGNSVTIGSLPQIAGTVTANVFGEDKISGGFLPIPLNDGGEAVLVDIKGAFGSGINVPISGTVTVGNTVTIAGVVTANPTGTQTIAGTVTLGAGTAQIGIVTANLTADAFGINGGDIASDDGGVEPNLGIQLGYYDGDYKTVNPSQPLPISGTVTVGNSVTIGSLPAISGTVTANTFALQGTAVTTSDFTSTTASTLLAGFNAGREVLTIFSEGPGTLFVCPGATCTTIAYQIRLSSGDYYEVPNHQTTITHSAVFATAGTARVTQVS